MPADVIRDLLRASISPATRRAYQLALMDFFQCVPGVSQKQGASIQDVLLFIARMHGRGMSAVSIRSKLLAASFWHHLHSWDNPCEKFLIKKAVKGAANLQPLHKSPQLPISPALLMRLIHLLLALGLAPFRVTMFTAVFCWHFLHSYG